MLRGQGASSLHGCGDGGGDGGGGYSVGQGKQGDFLLSTMMGSW